MLLIVLIASSIGSVTCDSISSGLGREAEFEP
jgi:hypothetical protein